MVRGGRVEEISWANPNYERGVDMPRLQGSAAVEFARNLVRNASPKELAEIREGHHIEGKGSYSVEAIGRLSQSAIETVARAVERANHE